MQKEKKTINDILDMSTKKKLGEHSEFKKISIDELMEKNKNTEKKEKDDKKGKTIGRPLQENEPRKSKVMLNFTETEMKKIKKYMSQTGATSLSTMIRLEYMKIVDKETEAK